jgi:Ca-activated chloride channel family protein
VSRGFWLLVWLAAVFLVTSARAYAQDCAECVFNVAPENSGMASEWSIKKHVNEVNVLFVAAQERRFIGDLSLSDITVRDDKKAPAAILGFQTEKELPLRVALLIDTSDSLTSRFRFEQVAASTFLRRSLSQVGDQGFVMGFSDHQRLMQDFTHDPDLLAQGVERLKIGGGTALYDAVRASCHRLLQHSEKDVVARVLVILSDCQSNTGTLHLEDAIDIAQRTGVTVYTISTHPSATASYMDDPVSVEGNRNLRRLAEQTGGRVLFPQSPKEIGKAFQKITEELRSRYVISYRPADFSQDGHYRTITIAARKAGKRLQVRARKGYYARPPSFWDADSADSAPNALSALAPNN